MPTKPYTANINSETGIAYGYIAASALDSDLVNELMDNGHDRNAALAYEAWEQETANKIQADGENVSDEEAREEAESRSHEFWENWEEEEPNVGGEYKGVKYCSSWLGGALNFLIFESPVTTTKARMASPCVPNAGILDTLDGNVVAYDVPADWRGYRVIEHYVCRSGAGREPHGDEFVIAMLVPEEPGLAVLIDDVHSHFVGYENDAFDVAILEDMVKAYLTHNWESIEGQFSRVPYLSPRLSGDDSYLVIYTKIPV